MTIILSNQGVCGITTEKTPPQPDSDHDSNRGNISSLNIEVTILLKYANSFCRSRDSPFNYKIELDLSCWKGCLLVQDNNIGVNFMITSTKRYVPFVTLSVSVNIKFSEHLREGFKGAISWNKYRSQITTPSENNNLDYMIDITIRSINTLFLQLFK